MYQLQVTIHERDDAYYVHARLYEEYQRTIKGCLSEAHRHIFFEAIHRSGDAFLDILAALESFAESEQATFRQVIPTEPLF